MRQLQFKFDPLPAESVGICLFHQRWIKTFYTQPFCQLCIKYGLVFYKNYLVQFCNNYLVVPSQKNLLSGTRKMENGSNLTRFQLNQQEFVFFTRGGSKLLTPNHFVNFALNMAQYFIKLIWSNFATNIWQVLHKKTYFRHSENGK